MGVLNEKRCKTQDIHNTTGKHIKNSAIDNDNDNEEIKNTNLPVKFVCKPCNYICSRKYDYNKHLSTRKHQLEISGNKKVANCFMCECGKLLQSNSGLWKHKKKCDGIEKNKEVNHELNEENTIGVETDKELLIKILLKNQEIMEKMMKIISNTGNNSHNLS